MTKEKAIKTLQEIVDGNWDGQSVEAIQYAINALSQPSLPSNLDEAAEKYANKEYPDEASCGQWGTGDYEPPVDMEYPREVAKDSFKAGAEWMAGQGASYQAVISADKTIPVLPMKDVSDMGLDYGDKVIVQIRKKD